MKNFIYAFFCLIFLFFSCSKKEEDERAKEQKKIKTQLNGTKIQLYKSIKIALRSTATVGQNPELDKARVAAFSLVGSVLQKGASLANKREKVEISPVELIALAANIYKTKETLLKTDEDSLPTLLANIFYVFTNSTRIKSPYFPLAYGNNHEHIFLSLLWQITPSTPKDFALYEVYKSDESNIEDLSLKLVYQLTKSFVFLENEYYYHSFDKANEYLTFMEKNKQLITETPIINLTDNIPLAGDKSYYQLHGMGMIIRALDEKKMGKEKEMLNDMEFFLDDMQKGGLDNELTWLVSAYVFISKEEYEKALPALEKLQKSDKISNPEKTAISELLKYLKERKKDSALNVFKDKLAFGKIAFDLMTDRLKQAKQLADLNKSEEGKKLVEVQQQINDKMKYFENAKGVLNNDSLTSKATGLIKNIFK